MSNNSESSPLLGTSASNHLNSLLTGKKSNTWIDWIKRNRLNVYVPIFLLSTLLITLITIFFYHVEPNLGISIAQGTSFDTDNIELIGLGSEGGIDLKITGTNFNNFTNIEDGLSRNYFKTGGFFLRSLNLKIDELDLVVFDEDKNDNKRLGKVAIAPFYVRIVDKNTTPMDLYATVFPNKSGVMGIIKKILTDPKAKLRLRGDASVKVLIFNGFVPITNIKIPLDLEFSNSLIV